MRGLDAEIITFLDQVADLAKEGRVGTAVDSRGGIVAKPAVDLRLHAGANLQKLAVARRQPMHCRVEACPEGIGCDVRTGKKLGFDKISKFRSDLHLAARHIVSHECLQELVRPGPRARASP